MKKKNVMRVMSRRGDDVLSWDPGNKREVAIAESTFYEYKAQGCTMFNVDPETKNTKLMENFFKDVPQIVVVKPLQGG